MKKGLLITTITFNLCFLSLKSFTQAPNLGTSSSFVLFTKAGAFSNAGSSLITGDIGADLGALTGFPPGTHLGQSHFADSISAQAALDVEASYSDLDSRLCGIVLGTTLGNNQTLTENVFCLGAASTLNANLILDGLGDPNALFIFQIDGAFTTNTLSSIELINGASIHNVYWQINGAVELGIGSVFRGTILANGAISLLEGASLFGRGLSRVGAINLNNNIANIGGLPLLIQLKDLKVTNHGNENYLNWSTKEECIGDVFEIEASSNGKTFTQIGLLPAAGLPSNYHYFDKSPCTGLNYYRLKMKDAFGGYTYSPIVTVHLPLKNIVFDVYPNPVTNSLKIRTNESNEQKIVYLSDITGKEIKRIPIESSITEIDVSTLTSGIYFINYPINTDAGVRIIKQ